MQRLRGAGRWEVSRAQASGEPEVCRVVAEHGKGGEPGVREPCVTWELARAPRHTCQGRRARWTGAVRCLSSSSLSSELAAAPAWLVARGAFRKVFVLIRGETKRDGEGECAAHSPPSIIPEKPKIKVTDLSRISSCLCCFYPLDRS